MQYKEGGAKTMKEGKRAQEMARWNKRGRGTEMTEKIFRQLFNSFLTWPCAYQCLLLKSRKA